MLISSSFLEEYSQLSITNNYADNLVFSCYSLLQLAQVNFTVSHHIDPIWSLYRGMGLWVFTATLANSCHGPDQLGTVGWYGVKDVTFLPFCLVPLL